MIDQRHSIPLETAVTASTPGRRALVQSLYAEAEAVFFDRYSKGGTVLRSRQVLSKLKKDKMELHTIVAEVVDLESGLFIRLNGSLDVAKSPAEAMSGPFLVFGKQFVSEMQNPQLQNTATKIWR